MIGIMSDSHDNLPAIRHAVNFFEKSSPQLILHAGDFVAPFSAKELEKLPCPVKAVFGNCDGEKKGLEKTFQSVGEIKNAPLTFEYKNIHILLTHVHTKIDSYLLSGKYDVIVYGHLHKPEVRKEGETLIINPGETGGWVSGKSTVALLDPEKLTAEIVSL